LKRPDITEQETIESLGPYFFIQRKAGHRLTSDTVALAEFAAQSLSENDTLIDLGTATGALPLLFSCKTELTSITGVEVDDEAAQTAARNVDVNGLADRVSIIKADYRNLTGMYPEGAFTAVVSNPPYTKAGSGRLSPLMQRAIARSEVLGGLPDLIKVSKHLAGEAGKIFYVFPVSRLAEMLAESQKCGLNVRRLRFINAGKGKEPGIFLIELGRQGGLEIEAPLSI